jgi:hypothetical protein
MTLAERLIKLDEFLLDRVFQPLTDRLGEKPSAFDVGISLELGAVVLELAADAALFAIHQLSITGGLWDGFSCACGMWFYVFMVRQRALVKPGRPNPLRLMYRSLRLLALGFALYSVFAAATSDPGGTLSYVFNALSNFAFVAGMYLISCQPRPPGWRAAQKAAVNNPWAAPQLG